MRLRERKIGVIPKSRCLKNQSHDFNHNPVGFKEFKIYLQFTYTALLEQNKQRLNCDQL